MSLKEGAIRKLLKDRIAAYGGEQRAVKWLGRSHAPDVLAFFPAYSTYSRRQCRDIWDGPKDTPKGWHIWAETKRPGKDATAAQAREHERMRAAGCVVLVITNEQELDAWLPPLNQKEWREGAAQQRREDEALGL